jgi:hypothetical protein
MLEYLQRWVLRRRRENAQPIPLQDPYAEPPPWLEQLLTLAQKSTRASARMALRLDDIERKLEGGFVSLRETLRQSVPVDVSSLIWDDLLDAMDLLEEAVQTTSTQGQGAMSDGLRGVLVRLERFLAQAQFERIGVPGAPPDGKLFRVVGTEHAPQLAEGVITRVVRAAVLQGERVVREGAVLTNRPDPGPLSGGDA